MWPFLFILAIVPLIFFWSDSVRELFPQLASYLPDKTSKEFVGADGKVTPPTARQTEKELNWVESDPDAPEGYVAYALSLDYQYRLAVGCRPQGQAVLQVTHISGQTLEMPLVLNYQFGALELTSGAFLGADLVGAVAQFDDVYLQNTSTAVYAQFKLDPASSGLIARAVQSNCPIVN